MTSSGVVELEATGLSFYSPHDEAAFFEWLSKLRCISKTAGHLRTIYISVEVALLDEEELREIIALFHRYSINKRQLIVFDSIKFSGWFSQPQNYWYNDVFIK